MFVNIFVAEQSVFVPLTPGQRENIWPQPRQRRSGSGPFDVTSNSPIKPAPTNDSRKAANSFGMEPKSPGIALRNLILSPVRRPTNRMRTNLFTYTSFSLPFFFLFSFFFWFFVFLFSRVYSLLFNCSILKSCPR